MVFNLDVGDVAPDFDLPTDAGRRPARRTCAASSSFCSSIPRTTRQAAPPKRSTSAGSRRASPRPAPRSIGLSPDSVKRHANFKRKHGLALTLAADESHATLEAYGVWKEKSMYGRKYMGVERTTAIVDPKGRVVRLWRKVKVPGHAEEALAALEAARTAFANH